MHRSRILYRRTLLILCALIVGLSLPARAEAHPLGNFTINLYSRLDLTGDQVRITYVVDMAEIPTYQALAELGGGPLSEQARSEYLAQQVKQLQPGLALTIDGQQQPLELDQQQLEILPGQGGLSIMRTQLTLHAPLPQLADAASAKLEYRDTNYQDHQGWHEIVVRNGLGIDLVASDRPTADISNELRAYPEDMLASPLDVRSASVTLKAGTGAALAAPPSAAEVVRSDDSFAALLSAQELSPLAMLLALLAAAGLGAIHALSPGHGKTIVAAYLVGARGTVRHAVFLGLTVTITHTLGVFALGLITLTASRYILPEQLYPWLSFLSGLLVLLMGLSLARHRMRSLRAVPAAPDHDHAGGDFWGDHEHGPDSHTHAPPTDANGRMSWSNLLALGVSGGLLPCPSALIVLLGAISIGKIGLGLSLIVAFSLGLAGVLTGIGLLMLYGTRLIGRAGQHAQAGVVRRGLRWAPLASAGLVTMIGLVMTARALIQTGLIG